MYKNYFYFVFIIILLYATKIAAQDTIEVAKDFKKILIFPDQILDDTPGNPVEFLSEVTSGSFGTRIIKLSYNQLGKPGDNYTNLNVITEGGFVYDFILKSVPVPKNKNSILITRAMSSFQMDGAPVPVIQEDKSKRSDTENEEIHNIKEEDKPTGAELREIKKKTRKDLTDELYANDREEYFRTRCYYLQFDKPVIPGKIYKNDDVLFQLKGVYYDRDEIYISYRIENKTTLDFDIRTITFGISTDHQLNSTDQLQPVDIEYRYKVPKTVKGKTENHFVVVFKKFSLNKNKVLLARLKEADGERQLQIWADHYKINDPIKL